jgi:amino-acid N-acetyltransferase
LFAAQIDNEVAGTIGWQTDGASGLLRSLSVKETIRGKGYGEALVNFLEAHAKQKGVRSLYLLTTTAAPFFSKRGYKTIARTKTPVFIQQTSEFTSLCPASATMMKKELG